MIGLVALLLAGTPGAGLAWAGPGDELLEALEVDFAQGPVDLSHEQIDARYEIACAAGATWLCEAAKWRPAPGEPPSLRQAGQAAKAACPQTGDVDPFACLVLGWSLTQTTRGSFDADIPTAAEGRAVFEQACPRLPRACAEAAVGAIKGVGPAPEAAPAIFAKACVDGEPYACVWEGKVLQLGLSGIPDLGAAQSRYQRTCDEGYAPGCNSLALLYETGLIGKDTVKAGELFSRACELGDPNACSNRALTLGETDPKAAAPFFHRGCDLGSDQLCFGWSYFAPEAEIPGLHARACDAGLGAACEAVAADLAAAGQDDKVRPALERACVLDHPPACTRLAGMAAAGSYGPVDLLKARALRERSCVRDEPQACYDLAIQLWAGEGVDKDKRTAKVVQKKACDLGLEVACKGAPKLPKKKADPKQAR